MNKCNYCDSFRSNLPESTPPVPLSWTMASQYTANQSIRPTSPYIDQLLDDLFKKKDCNQSAWPFLADDDDWDYGFSLGAAQPKTDVQVTFSSLHQRCHSLLVELKPWALLINQSGLDLCLKHGDPAHPDWLVPSRSVIAPPHLTDTFHIGLVLDHSSFYSPPLILQVVVVDPSFFKNAIRIFNDKLLNSIKK